MSLFEKQEYLRRINVTKARMQGLNIDVLLVASPENINYLTGYAGWSFYTPQLAILSIDEDEPYFVTRLMDVPCAEITAFLKPENVYGFPERYIGTDLHPMEYIAGVIAERGHGTGVIGVEKNAHFFPVRSFEILQHELSDARFVDADLLVDWVRAVKSEPEIAIMRQAGDIATRTMNAAIGAIGSGVRQCDVAAELYAAQLRGAPDYGGGVPNTVVMSSGDNTRAPHLKWNDSKYEKGTPINIELSGCRHQYHAAIARTIHVGAPPQGLVNLVDVVEDAMLAALETFRAGIPVEETVKAWFAVINKAGYTKSSRMGYSIGMCFQPTWGERTISLQIGEKTIMEPNMCFHVLSGMWEQEHRLCISETIRVTENGYEQLTHCPRILHVKD